MLRSVLSLTLCVGALALSDSNLRTSAKASGFVRALEFKHRLRVCNAYPYAAAIDVYNGKSNKLTKDMPMHYRTCKDFLAPLQSGNKLEFMVGDASTGTFAVSDLPNNDAILLLVIYRHDTTSTAVSFESHVFANLRNAQVAIMDTYKGAAQSAVKIMDAAQKGKSRGRYEELRYDSIVAVDPGNYEVELLGSDGKAHAKSNFVALADESYVIIRTGIEAKQGPAYPQELLIYPSSHSSAALCRASVAVFAAALAIARWW